PSFPTRRSSDLHRLYSGVHGAVSGHDDDTRVGVLLAQPRERGEAVDARHPDVEEDQVEGLRLEGPQRAVAVLDGHHVVAGLPQALLQHPAEAVLVVGDQQARSYRGDGRVTVRWARS